MMGYRIDDLLWQPPESFYAHPDDIRGAILDRYSDLEERFCALCKVEQVMAFDALRGIDTFGHVYWDNFRSRQYPRGR